MQWASLKRRSIGQNTMHHSWRKPMPYVSPWQPKISPVTLIVKRKNEKTVLILTQHLQQNRKLYSERPRRINIGRSFNCNKIFWSCIHCWFSLAAFLTQANTTFYLSKDDQFILNENQQKCPNMLYKQQEAMKKQPGKKIAPWCKVQWSWLLLCQ